jgi:hypothetical protein
VTSEPACPNEEAVVAAQIGRPPRAPWRVVVRCAYGHPRVIASPPRLADGTPFPTTYWLTCPLLVSEVGEVESAGGADVWTRRVERDRRLARLLGMADAAYRVARSEEGGGEDPCADTGIAGTRDPRRVKCLHAHVAAYLAGIPDPVGEAIAAGLTDRCQDERCAGIGTGRSRT